mmetsp:Transcript_82076/g.129246  ORF Transcript_82076/g.129246 Transcript_82076/m.129246 type:complete len:178 (-) Transcript_82076:64-597(-)
MALLDKGLLSRARNLVAAADRMVELAAAPEIDPTYIKESRRRDALNKACHERELQQSTRELKIMDKHMRAEDVLQSNARRRQIAIENRRCENEVRHVANSIQRQFRNDPVLKRAKAGGARQQRLMDGGQCILSSSSSLPSLQTFEKGRQGPVHDYPPIDDVLKRAKQLNAKVWRELG